MLYIWHDFNFIIFSMFPITMILFSSIISLIVSTNNICVLEKNISIMDILLLCQFFPCYDILFKFVMKWQNYLYVIVCMHECFFRNKTTVLWLVKYSLFLYFLKCISFHMLWNHKNLKLFYSFTILSLDYLRNG